MAITFFGAASNPADNSAQAGPGAVAVTPPSSMAAGDLCVVYCMIRLTIGSIATIPRMFTNANVATAHGGQRWNDGPAFGNTNIQGRIFWCRFNGTWSADPSWRVDSSTEAMTVVMMVFRPTTATNWWVPQIGPLAATFTAATTITIGSQTSATKFSSDSHVAIGAWITADANTWNNLSGTGWSQTNLSAQYRNTTGSDMSAAFAYNIQTSSGATNAVSLDEATLGTDAGATMLVVFTEYAAPATAGSAGNGSSVQSAVQWVENTGTSQSAITASLASDVTSGNSVMGHLQFEDAPSGAVYLVSIVDDIGNHYYPIRFIYDVALNQCSVLFFRSNITNAPQTFTVTISASNSFSFQIIVSEMAGAWNHEDSAGALYQGQDSFNPEPIVAYPAITPAGSGRLLFLGVNLTGSGSASDSWTALGSFAEILEHARTDSSDNNIAIHSFVQGAAASVTGQAQLTATGIGHMAIAIMGVFAAPQGGGVPVFYHHRTMQGMS